MDSSTHTDDTHSNWELLLVPYVLGELAGAERDALEQQLSVSPELREQLSELELASASLVAATPQFEAPASLKSSVFAAIDAASAHDAQVVNAAPLAATAAAAAIDDEPDAIASTPSPQRRSAERSGASWWQSFKDRFAVGPALTGALALGCVVLLALLVDTRGSLNETKDQLALEQTTPSQTAPATTRVVETQPAFNGARGRLVRDGDQWVLVFENVPSPGNGASWQVWTADQKGKISNVAQWTTDESTHVLSIEDADQIDQVMISHEKTPDPVAAPSGAPVAAVTT